MTQDPSDKINAFITASEKVRPILSERHGRTIGSDELQNALCRVLGIDELNSQLAAIRKKLTDAGIALP